MSALAALDIDTDRSSAPMRGAPAAGTTLRRVAVLAGAAASFALIFVVRELTAGAGDSLGDAVGLVYVLPICLVALELGITAGIAAALGVTAAVVVSVAVKGGDIDGAALFVRAVIFLAAAALAGTFNERARARSRREALRLDALNGEVETMRGRLTDQLHNAGRMLERHERERRDIAFQLHDEAAQTLAAALLTVRMLERGSEGAVDPRRLVTLREHVRACIADLRRIADSLRPPVLDEMGLIAALQRVSEVEAEAGRRSVSFHVDGLGALRRELETSVYRLVEDLIGALADATEIDVALSTSETALSISLLARIEDERGDGAELYKELDSRLISARVRVELQGGSFAALPAPVGLRVSAVLPLGG